MYGLSVLNIARHFLKEQEREEHAALRERQSQSGQTERLRRFKHWLSERSPRLGNLWRFRERIAPDVEVRKRDFPRVGTLASPYAAYREMVKRRFPEKMDASRLDAAIALYMRCAGYTPQEVANELYRHTPARPRGENRESTGVGWSGMPSGRLEILILPMYGLRRHKFSSLFMRRNTLSTKLVEKKYLLYLVCDNIFNPSTLAQ